MKLLRVLLPIALFLSLATWAVGVPSRFAWPDEGGGTSEQLLGFFAVDTGGVGAVVPRCAAYGFLTTADLACAVQSPEMILARDVTISRVDAVAGPRTAGANDGCQLDLRLESPAGAADVSLAGVAVINYGSGTADLVGAANNVFNQTGLSISVSAGDTLKVHHTTPTDTSYCTTPPCVCATTGTASYRMLIYGTYD